MLVGLLTIWLLGDGASASMTVGYVDQLTAYAKAQIADPAQRKAVLDVAKALERAGIAEGKGAAEAGKAVVKITQNRSAKPQDIEAPLSRAAGYTIELQNELLQQRSRLKSQLTREQWVAMHAAPR